MLQANAPSDCPSNIRRETIPFESTHDISLTNRRLLIDAKRQCPGRYFTLMTTALLLLPSTVSTTFT